MIKKYIFIISCFIFIFTFYNISFAKEPIKTTKITMDTLTDNIDKSILSDKEIEDLIINAANKSFEKISTTKDKEKNSIIAGVSDININHIGRDITIKILYDESQGNIDTLINTGIFNYFSLTKDFTLYNTNFEIEVRYEDINGRMIKQHMFSYTFNKETLQKIDWNNTDYKDFINNADKYWTINDGPQENDKIIEDSFQLKIIDILKDYISYKLTNLEN